MKSTLLVLSLSLIGCGSRTAGPTKLPSETVSACGPCSEDRTCISFFEVGRPDAPKHSCEKTCVPGANSCAADSECTMLENGPGLVCRAKPPARTYDQATKNAAELIRIWGDVRFSHPAAAGGDVDWDAALLENVSAAMAAPNDEAFFKVVSQMLAKLGDSSTRVGDAKTAQKASNAALMSTRQDGSRLIVDMGGGSITGLAQVRGLEKELIAADEIIFDLRGLDSGDRFRLDFIMTMVGASLIASPIELPSTQTLLYEGFKTQGLGSPLYGVALEQTLPERLTPGDNGKRKRIGFVLGADSPLPQIAVPLWHAGLAHIVAPKPDVAAVLEPTKSLEIRGRTIAVRVGSATYKGKRLTISADATGSADPLAQRNLSTSLRHSAREITVARCRSFPDRSVG